MSDLKITPKERNLATRAVENQERRREFLERFWRSRLEKKDPVARIGFSLWCINAEKLKRVIAEGDKEYWNHRRYKYWNYMAASTYVNVAAGLHHSGFEGDVHERDRKIEWIGARIAKKHIEIVSDDYRNKTGKVPGLLSLRQMADYHHAVFEGEGIPRHYYGGTRVELIPDEWEFELYGDLYCHDCDPRP